MNRSAGAVSPKAGHRKFPLSKFLQAKLSLKRGGGWQTGISCDHGGGLRSRVDSNFGRIVVFIMWPITVK